MTAADELTNDLRKRLVDLRERADMSERGQALLLKLSPSSWNDFMAGRQALGLATWKAIYRTYPPLQELLTEYQRRSALEDEEAETATPTGRR